MPVPNTRVAIVGRASVDREFEIVEISKKEALRLAKILERGTDEARREVQDALRRMVGRVR